MEKKKFKLAVIATFAEEYEVEADSLEEAEEKAKERLLFNIKCPDMDLDVELQVHEA